MIKQCPCRPLEAVMVILEPPGFEKIDLFATNPIKQHLLLRNYLMFIYMLLKTTSRKQLRVDTFNIILPLIRSGLRVFFHKYVHFKTMCLNNVYS